MDTKIVDFKEQIRHLSTFELNSVTIVAGLVIAFAIRLVWKAIYRLYFHPLAKFPGPKLAALSYWYEGYYDLIANGGGQTAFQIKRLHDQYGPLVRISPEELHLDDPDFYNIINCNATVSHPIDKIDRFKYRFNVPEATVSTVEFEKHRVRRAAMSPFFSKTRIKTLNDKLSEITERISCRLATEYRGTGRVIIVSDMWATMTADVITELTFARSTGFSAAPDFKSPYSQAMASSVLYAHYTTHFDWLREAMNWLPDNVLGFLMPHFRPILDYRVAIRRQIKDMLAGKNTDAKDASHLTIFHDILASDLPPEDKAFDRLVQEAMSVNGAGIETTMWTLTVATFHVLHNPHVLRTLKSELAEAMPDPSVIFCWEELEALPYLSAIIQEALRMAIGSVQRLPRVNRLDPIAYGDWVIPPNVSVSMDAFHNHFNETIFPNANTFRPERWLAAEQELHRNAFGTNGIVRPFRGYWMPTIEAVRWNRDMYNWTAIAPTFLGLICDVTYVILPSLIIWKLNMPMRRKLALLFLMGLSLLTAGSALAKITVSLIPMTGNTNLGAPATKYFAGIINLCSNCEQSLVIIMGCLPTLRVISRVEFGFPSLKKIGSSFSGLLYRSKRTGVSTKQSPKYTDLTRESHGRSTGGTHGIELRPKVDNFTDDDSESTKLALSGPIVVATSEHLHGDDE